jgi:hypothetical protein
MEASGKKLRLYLKALGSRKKRKLAPGEARDAASELVLFPKPMENPEEIQAPSEKEMDEQQKECLATAAAGQAIISKIGVGEADAAA